MSKPMSTRQVRNAVKSLNLVLVNGHDIKINGDFRGSSGFITDAAHAGAKGTAGNPIGIAGDEVACEAVATRRLG